MSTSSSGGNVSFNSFPATKKEFLAALYVQSQNLSGATPEEIVSMYDDAYEKVDAEFNRLRARSAKCSSEKKTHISLPFELKPTNPQEPPQPPEELPPHRRLLSLMMPFSQNQEGHVQIHQLPLCA